MRKKNQEGVLENYVQRCGHIDNSGRHIPDLTLSSEILKQTSSTETGYNLNLAMLQKRTSENKTFHIGVRSARSDNPSRLHKLIQYSFISSWNSENKPGITKDENGSYSYQLILFTALDSHPLRNFLKKTSQNPPITEAESLGELKKSVKTIWKKHDEILIEVIIDEKPFLFFAKKPLLINIALSDTSKDPEFIKDTRSWSRRGVLNSLDILRKTKEAISSEHFGSAFKALNKKLEGDLKLSFKRASKFLSKLSQHGAFKDIAEQKLYLALKGLKINLTNSDFEGVEQLGPVSPAHEILYHFHLANLINASIALQCKAGCDRALIMTSLLLASKRVEEQYSHLFDFEDLESKEFFSDFTDEFKSFCGTFGKPILETCRGEAFFLGKDKPIIQELIIDTSLPNSIPGLIISR